MTFPATNALRQIARRVRARMTRAGVILMYHRIADVQADPWGLCVSPRHFAEHLDVLRAQWVPLQLHRLVSALEDGSPPQHAVSLTFDDGYADNLYAAAPLLERFGVPATIFVTTGYTSSERAFWWDELERLLLQPGALPSALRLTIDGQAREWDLSETTEWRGAALKQHRAWRAWEHPPTPRHALYHDLWNHLYRVSGTKKQKILTQVEAWVSTPSDQDHVPHPLSAEEVTALAQSDLIDVGAHTVSHPALTLLSTASQKEEIQQSKVHLEQLLQRPVEGFSYPHGDYLEETASIVRGAGFAYACSTAGAPVTADTDHFQLPRYQVLDWDGDEFSKRLVAWRTSAHG